MKRKTQASFMNARHWIKQPSLLSSYALLIIFILIFRHFDMGITVEHGQSMNASMGIFFLIAFFGIHYFKSRTKKIINYASVFIIALSFFNIYWLGSMASYGQFFFVSLLILAFLQLANAQNRQLNIGNFAKLMTFANLLMCFSILVDTYYSQSRGDQGSLFFPVGPPGHGLMANIGYSAIFILLTMFFVDKKIRIISYFTLYHAFKAGTASPLAIAIIIESFELFHYYIKNIRKLHVVIISFTFCFFSYFAFKAFSFKNDFGPRIFIWEKSIHSVIKKPLFGYGLGFFFDANFLIYEQYVPEVFNEDAQIDYYKSIKIDRDKLGGKVYSQMHNEIFECLFSYGLIGSFFFLIILIQALRSKLLDRRFHKALYALILISQFWFPFHLAATALLGTIIIAVLVNGNIQTGVKNA